MFFINLLKHQIFRVPIFLENLFKKKKFMGNLDVDSLFTNILPEETTDIALMQPFENTERVEGLSKIEVKEL